MREMTETKILKSVDRALWKKGDGTNRGIGFLWFVAAVIVVIASLFLVSRTMAGEVITIQPGVYIGSHDNLTVDDYLYLSEGAEDSLSSGYSYSEDEVRAMLGVLTDRSGGRIDFSSAVDDVSMWNRKTGADVSAMLALICCEGGCTSSHGLNHWNFFNLTAPDKGASYGSGGISLWDAKQDCSDLGEALVLGMDRIYMGYWVNGQDSFYKMSFNGYGHPQDADEAYTAEKKLFHSYLPWWEDENYVSGGFQSDCLWVNRAASIRKSLREKTDSKKQEQAKYLHR